MVQGAAVRAGASQHWLAFVNQRDPAGSEEMLAMLRPSDRIALCDASPNEWVSWQHDKFLREAVIRQFGEAPAAKLWRDYLPPFVQDAPLGKVFDSAARLFGFKPSALVRAMPLAFRHAYRGLGELKVTQAAHRIARLELRSIPDEVLDWPSYAFSHAAMFEGIFDLAKVEGELEVKHQAHVHRSEFIFRWD